MPVVRTPVPGFTGESVGVEFVDGQGETDDPAALRYFAAAGYHIESTDPSVSQPPKAGPGSSKAAWADYATSLGLDPEGMSRDELIDAIGDNDDG